MPRTLQEIIDHQEEIADAFEQYEPRPSDWNDPQPLDLLRNAVRQRATAESALVDAVAAAREAGYAWGTIGNLIGTTGEAARQRYGKLINQ
ncbi:hypothetical protein GCM10027174_44770 [Salinifilum aidingensis]